VFCSLNRWVPWQNLAGVAVVLGLSSAVAMFGLARLGPQPSLVASASNVRLDPLPITRALLGILWMVLILASRGLSRWLLRGVSPSRNYGIWLTTLSGLLAVGLSLSAAPYVAREAQVWLWGMPGGASLTLGGLGAGLAVWLGLALATNILMVPWLLKRKPGPVPEDVPALTVWLALQGYLFLGNVRHGLGAQITLVGGTVAVLVVGAVAARCGGGEPDRHSSEPRQGE